MKVIFCENLGVEYKKKNGLQMLSERISKAKLYRENMIKKSLRNGDAYAVVKAFVDNTLAVRREEAVRAKIETEKAAAEKAAAEEKAKAEAQPRAGLLGFFM